VGKLNQIMAAAGRSVAWLLPAGRRDWAAAIWAEARAVPPGLTRLAWRAGGVWMLAREALMPRRLGRALLFAAAAAAAGWAAWPQPWAGHIAEARFNAIAPALLVVAVLPLLSGRLFGPASPGRTARFMRVLCGATVLGLVSAFTVLDAYDQLAPTKPAYFRIFCGPNCPGAVPGRGNGGPTWQAEILIMGLIVGYVGVTFYLTSRRAALTRSTLVIGTGTGLLFGAVMFAVDPLGVTNLATNPWLPGSAADPLVVLAWIMLFGGPAAAGVLAGRRCRGPGGARRPHMVRFGQGVAAGLLANGLAAMLTSMLGAGTALLLVKSPGLVHWVTPGRHLTAIATYRYELNTGNNAGGYLLMLMFFPVIGLVMSTLAAAITNPAPRQSDRVPVLVLRGPRVTGRR
jgi:hypothetical protein